MSYTTNVAVTALNIMDGIALHEKWDELQAVWEREGGFLEFCIWITEIAEESERQLVEP